MAKLTSTERAGRDAFTQARNEILKDGTEDINGEEWQHCACGWLEPAGSRFCGNAAHAGNIREVLKIKRFRDPQVAARLEMLRASRGIARAALVDDRTVEFAGRTLGGFSEPIRIGADSEKIEYTCEIELKAQDVNDFLDNMAKIYGAPERMLGETDMELRARVQAKLEESCDAQPWVLKSLVGVTPAEPVSAGDALVTGPDGQIIRAKKTEGDYQQYAGTGSATRQYAKVARFGEQTTTRGLGPSLVALRKAAGVCPTCGDKARESAVGICRDHGKFLG